MKFYIHFLLFLYILSLLGCSCQCEKKREEIFIQNFSFSDNEWGNTTCPVMRGVPIKKKWSTVYQGRIVYFCCESCIKDFESEPEKYRDELIAVSRQER